MKKLCYLLLFLAVFLGNFSQVLANEIHSIKVDAKLDKEGNGVITEVWDMSVDHGTENYKPMSNLGNSTISNFKVVDENGQEYTSLSSWDVNADFSSKAYKSGINYTSNGLELCWGMSSYGKHIYTISYNVSNMIYNVDDAQVLYWKFINDSMNPAPKRFNVTVKGPVYYQDTLDVWGYGYEGYAYVKNGVISMSNVENRNFQSNEYAVALVKYPLETFTTSNYNNNFKSFDEVLGKAQQGSYQYDYNDDNNNQDDTFLPSSFGLPFFVFKLMWWVSTIVIAILVIKNSSHENYQKTEIDYGMVKYFRDIPCNKDIFEAFFIANVYKLNKRKEDLLGAVLLKWLKEGKVKIVKQQKKKIFGTKEITAIDLTNYIPGNNDCENKLYNIMNIASNDGLLEENELKKWCSRNYSKFFRWFDDTIEESRDKLIQEGHITVSTTRKVLKNVTYTLDNYIYEQAMQLAGLRYFLNEFSLMNEKEPIEVMLWEEYLIFAQIFGIASEVANQFKKLYPELIEQSNYNFDYSNVMWISSISTSSIKSASSARESARSYSSGGGGFSSGGGGGGSSGGGSGGGCR